MGRQQSAARFRARDHRLLPGEQPTIQFAVDLGKLVAVEFDVPA
jgi:hypothetical protein